MWSGPTHDAATQCDAPMQRRNNATRPATRRNNATRPATRRAHAPTHRRGDSASIHKYTTKAKPDAPRSDATRPRSDATRPRSDAPTQRRAHAATRPRSDAPTQRRAHAATRPRSDVPTGANADMCAEQRSPCFVFQASSSRGGGEWCQTSPTAPVVFAAAWDMTGDAQAEFRAQDEVRRST
jgi:hypothetical protein